MVKTEGNRLVRAGGLGAITGAAQGLISGSIYAVPRIFDRIQDPNLNYLTPMQHLYANLWVYGLTVGVCVTLNAFVNALAYMSLSRALRRN